jgi:hypothetical protein
LDNNVFYEVSMKRNKGWDNIRPLPRAGDVTLDQKPLATKLEPEIAQAVRSLSNPSAWMRRVISEAARRELLGKEDKKQELQRDD